MYGCYWLLLYVSFVIMFAFSSHLLESVKNRIFVEINRRQLDKRVAHLLVLFFLHCTTTMLHVLDEANNLAKCSRPGRTLLLALLVLAIVCPDVRLVY